MELRIEKGGMEARILARPEAKETGGFLYPSASELEVFLKEKGVRAPPDRAAVQTALEGMARGIAADFVAARGKPPERGKDGWLEPLLDSEAAFVPAAIPTSTGAVDMRASLIRTVEPGRPLAIVHAPTAGVPGIDVFGNLVPSEPGRPLEPRLGANTRRAPHDPGLIVADTTGHARIVDGVPEVQEFYVVPGDVDYGTGNVAFPKSVQVRGDVKAGFSVEAGGDVEIQGLVEDCEVKARGRILIRGGFTGQGKGKVQAAGDIDLGYVRNQAVRGEACIRIAREAVNSKLQSRDTVSVSGLLAGGRAQARRSIECQIAGTETGATTHLEAGFDYTLAEEMTDIRAELDKMGKYSRQLGDSLRHLQDMERVKRGLDPWAIELVFEMESKRGKVEGKIRWLRDRYAALDREASPPEDATITVHRKAFPGVVVKIGREMLLVEEPMTGPRTFYAKDGAILVK